MSEPNEPTPTPPPEPLLLDRPVVLGIGDGRQLEFDGVQVTIRRHTSADNPGQEMIPLRQIVSVAVDREKPPDRPNCQLTISLATGRTVKVEFRSGFVREVEQFQRAVSKGAALLQAPTADVSRQVAQELSQPVHHYGVWIFLAVLVVLALWILL